MKQTRLLTGILGSGLVLLVVLSLLRRDQSPGPSSSSPPPGLPQASAPVEPASHVNPAVNPAPAQRAAAVASARPVAPDPEVFERFAAWTRQYAAADAAGRKALEADGVELARARRAELAAMIPSDPQRALSLSLPYATRQLVPASVRDLLEEPVNATGDLAVLGVMPLPGAGDSLPPVIRRVTVEGREFEAFTYGAGEAFVTRRGVPLAGIVVPNGAGPVPYATALGQPLWLMALAENPAQVLGADQVADRQAARAAAAVPDPICSVSGAAVTVHKDETAVALGGVIRSFCGQVHAGDWANAGVAAAGLNVPSPETPVTAESSYTEGRKRMLLMRPVWSDYTSGMDTNQALSHYTSLSNYMYTMSYGRHVLAPLGQGSEITPSMLLPGLVATYDNTGLGLLYNTCKTVARDNHGYDLTKFDFLYVCTGGRPAASYAGLAFVGGVGFHLANGYWDSATSAHEYGHNLGLNHAHFWDTGAQSVVGTGQNVEYGDGNDPMGGGGSPNQYNSRYKNYLGWIKDGDIADLNTLGSGRYRLYCFDLDTGTGLRGLKFRYDGSKNYWINFRQRKTDKRALMNGVQLLWTGNGNQGSYLLDVRLKGGSDDNAVVVGRTYSDPALGFHFTPVGKGNTWPESMDIIVQVGNVASNRPPAVGLSAGSANPSPGQPVVLTATASDPNGDALAYFWEFGDGSSSYSVDNAPVQTHTFAAAGEYTVQCTVSDMKGGATRQSLVVRVGSPAGFRISGHVLDAQNRPLAGIRVSTDRGQSVLTDSDGSYTLAGLSANSYTLTAIEPLAGGYSFTHPFFNNPVTVGPSFTTADFIGVTGSLNLYTPIVARGATWKYLDNGSDQGAGWSAPGFVDTGWSNGVAPLGYPSGAPITTVIGYGPSSSAKYITTYFRRQFTVPNPAAYTNFLLEVLRDDGVVVYLNGTEVFRNNLPTNGAITAATTALDSVEADSYLQLTLPNTAVLAGVNTLAAEVHQVEATSSDIAFEAALSGLSVSNAVGFNLFYLSAPAGGVTVAPGTNVTLAATYFTGGAAPANVDFYGNGVRLGADATAPFNFTWTNPPVGSHLVHAVTTLGGKQVTSPPVRFSVSFPIVAPGVSSLSPTGAVWRFLFGGTAAPPTWTSLVFNDANWTNGPAELGYGDSDERTRVPFGPNANNKWITTYFRRAVVVPDPAGIASLTLRLKRDDGAIVYLNGAEVVRDNLAAGSVTHLTTATNDADDGRTFWSFAVDPARLVTGTNVLAVEVHQDSGTSSDISFDLALDAVVRTNRPRGIYLVSPAAGASLSTVTPISIAAEVVAGGSLGVRRVEFFANGTPVGSVSNAPFQLNWVPPIAGAFTLTAVGTDTAGAAITGGSVAVTVQPPPRRGALISLGEVWKYLDDGSNPGTTWTGPGYDDRGWYAGAARLGYGGDGEVTRLYSGTNDPSRPLSYYFRKAVVVPDPAAYHSLLLRLVRDDGAAVYINGVEVLRNNLAAGPLSYNSLALTSLGAPDETVPLEITLPAGVLVAGTNLVAVQVHQSGITSSDLGFDLSLQGLNTNTTPASVYLVNPPAGERVIVGARVALSAYAASAGVLATRVEYYAGNTRLGEATNAPYEFPWTATPAGVYQITARATFPGGILGTSAPVAVTVGTPPPTVAPVLAALIPAGDTWRYWDSSVAPGAGWAGGAFDDSAWPAGPARFGWGLDGEKTLLETRTSHYFRRSIVVTNPALFTELVFHYQRDDGLALYLNGRELFRSNLPEGALTPATLALASVNTPEETTWFEVSVPISGSGLLAGTNVLAVELHQSGATSSDAAFDLQLYGVGSTAPRALLTSPAGGSVLPAGSVSLTALAWPGTGATVSRVEFLADGGKIGEALTPPYQFTWSGAAPGEHRLAARLITSTGITVDSDPVDVTIGRETVSQVVIATNAVWRYLDDGSDQGTNWVRLNYNDTAWRQGAARLGYGGDGETTLIRSNRANGTRITTTYFRRTFVVPPDAVYTNLLFRLIRDDGAVVWLNGVEMYRVNLPAGPVLAGTLATTSVNNADETTLFPSSFNVAPLPVGTNIVAVEIHQQSLTSSDVGFALELTASGYEQSSTPPVLSVEFKDDQVELSWPAAATGWRVVGASDPTQPAGTWSLVPATPFLQNNLWKVTVAPTEDRQFFRLRKP